MAPTDPSDTVDAALRIAAALEAAEIPYAVGGALAYGIWAVPRATVDVDLNVFVEPAAIGRVFSALSEVGARLDVTSARAQNTRDGMFVAHFGLFRIDVFTPSIEFSGEAERTRVRRELDGQSVWFLSAEAIAVFKLMFFRTKDVADLERLVALRPQLDCGWVRAQIVTMMGEGDERVAGWDRLVETFRAR